jgi:hypothetical protein
MSADCMKRCARQFPCRPRGHSIEKGGGERRVSDTPISNRKGFEVVRIGEQHQRQLLPAPSAIARSSGPSCPKLRRERHRLLREEPDAHGRAALARPERRSSGRILLIEQLIPLQGLDELVRVDVDTKPACAPRSGLSCRSCSRATISARSTASKLGAFSALVRMCPSLA